MRKQGTSCGGSWLVVMMSSHSNAERLAPLNRGWPNMGVRCRARARSSALALASAAQKRARQQEQGRSARRFGYGDERITEPIVPGARGGVGIEVVDEDGDGRAVEHVRAADVDAI